MINKKYKTIKILDKYYKVVPGSCHQCALKDKNKDGRFRCTFTQSCVGLLGIGQYIFKKIKL